MRRIVYFTICFFLLLSAAWFRPLPVKSSTASWPRSIASRVLRSDWDEAVCFEAFMQQKPLSAVTEADRVLALQRLIDRQLLKAQMGNANYMLPSEDELRQDVAKLRAQVPNGNDDESWRKLLASYGLNEADSEAAPAHRSSGDELRGSPASSQCAHSGRRDRGVLPESVAA